MHAPNINCHSSVFAEILPSKFCSRVCFRTSPIELKRHLMEPERRGEESTLVKMRLPLAYILDVMESRNKYSWLEKMIMLSSLELVRYLMSFMDPHTLARLRQASSLMRNTVKYYQSTAWRVGHFFSRYINGAYTGILREHMRDTSALAFGPAALEFFDRTVTDNNSCHRLDIAVPCGIGTWALGDFLMHQGYTVKGGEYKFQRATFKDSRKSETFATGDRFASEQFYDSQKFVFSMLKTGSTLSPTVQSCVIILHSVNCDPYLHVLSQHSSKSNNTTLLCIVIS